MEGGCGEGGASIRPFAADRVLLVVLPRVEPVAAKVVSISLAELTERAQRRTPFSATATIDSPRIIERRGTFAAWHG
jgi:hypothetical protein